MDTSFALHFDEIMDHEPVKIYHLYLKKVLKNSVKFLYKLQPEDPQHQPITVPRESNHSNTCVDMYLDLNITDLELFEGLSSAYLSDTGHIYCDLEVEDDDELYIYTIPEFSPIVDELWETKLFSVVSGSEFYRKTAKKYEEEYIYIPKEEISVPHYGESIIFSATDAFSVKYDKLLPILEYSFLLKKCKIQIGFSSKDFFSFSICTKSMQTHPYSKLVPLPQPQVNLNITQSLEWTSWYPIWPSRKSDLLFHSLYMPESNPFESYKGYLWTPAGLNALSPRNQVETINSKGSQNLKFIIALCLWVVCLIIGTRIVMTIFFMMRDLVRTTVVSNMIRCIKRELHPKILSYNLGHNFSSFWEYLLLKMRSCWFSFSYVSKMKADQLSKQNKELSDEVKKLKVQVKLLKSLNTKPYWWTDSPKSKITKRWKWKDDNYQWQFYDITISEKIQKMKHFTTQKMYFNGYNYQITRNTNTGKQKNLSTKKERSMDLVRYECPYDLVIPNSNNRKFLNKALQKLCETIDGNSYDICAWAVQNERLHTEHKFLENEWKYNNRCENNNIKYLWHGTSKNVIYNEILTYGFNRNFNKRHVWGKGDYFSNEANYSLGYSDLESDDCQYLLYCRVLCGDSCVGTTNMLQTGLKYGSEFNYETIVNDRWNPYIYVCTMDKQACPLALFQLKRKDNE